MAKSKKNRIGLAIAPNAPVAGAAGPDPDEKLMQEIADSIAPDMSPSKTPEPGVSALKVMEGGTPKAKVTMDEDQIQAILDQHILSASDWVGSQIAISQAEAMRYYLGLAEGDLAPPDVEDRSAVVDTVVSDQIEWLMPSLMEIFFASGNPVKFNPRKPGDEDAAEMMTNLANHVIQDQNPGFEVFADWFKTALISKVGVAKVWWQEDTDQTQESYNGLTDGQLAVLSDDAEVTLTSIESFTDPVAERMAMEQYKQAQAQFPQMQQQYAMMQAKAQAMAQQPQPSQPSQPTMPGGMPPGGPQPTPGSQPLQQGQPPQGQPPQLPPPPKPPVAPDVSTLPMLHNVVMTRVKKAGHVAIGALNPEDFLISPDSVRIEDGFCAHRVQKTMSQLREEYPSVDDVEDISSEQNAETQGESSLFIARHALEDIFTQLDYDGSDDESQRKVWLYECYLPIDCDEDGIAEWRKITKAGNLILENEICDCPPFAALCPVRIPGLFYGRSIADLAMPIQRIKTGLLRSLIDNVNLQVNGRTWAIEGQVNFEDLLTNRPGGIVRVKSPTAVGQMQQGLGDAAGAYQLLQYVDTMSQERTGITKYSQGLDSDTLNHTASGIENITQRADLRVKLIARSFAEGGVKELVRLIQKFLCNYQEQAMTFQLNGKWVDVDPRVWRNQYSMSVTVGTGTGDTTRKVQQLMQLSQMQQQGMQIGIATPENMYHTAVEATKALQLGEASPFWTDPATQPPKPPQPNPQIQIAQMQLQSQEKIEAMKAQLQQQTDAAKIQAQTQQANQEAQSQAVLEQQHQQLIDSRERDIQAQQQAWQREQFYASLAQKREQAALMAKVDTGTEQQMNNSIQQDQIADQQQAIPDEVELAKQLLNS